MWFERQEVHTKFVVADHLVSHVFVLAKVLAKGVAREFPLIVLHWLGKGQTPGRRYPPARHNYTPWTHSSFMFARAFFRGKAKVRKFQIFKVSLFQTFRVLINESFEIQNSEISNIQEHTFPTLPSFQILRYSKICLLEARRHFLVCVGVLLHKIREPKSKQL